MVDRKTFKYNMDIPSIRAPGIDSANVVQGRFGGYYIGFDMEMVDQVDVYQDTFQGFSVNGCFLRGCACFSGFCGALS